MLIYYRNYKKITLGGKIIKYLKTGTSHFTDQTSINILLN